MLTFAPSLKFHCKMKLFEFAQRFPDEASCESYLKAQREKSGIVCKKCGCRKRFPDEASCESYLKAQREKSGIVCKKCGCRKNYWIASTIGICRLVADNHNK